MLKKTMIQETNGDAAENLLHSGCSEVEDVLLKKATPETLVHIINTRNNPVDLINSKALLLRSVRKCKRYLLNGASEEYANWLKVCESILEIGGVDLNVIEHVEEDTNRPLSIAIEAKDLKLVEMLLCKGANSNALGGFRCRYSMIVIAIQSDSIEILNLLLKYGADVNMYCHNFNGLYCPLNYSYYTYENHEIFNILLNLPNVSLKQSRLLHTAAKNGDVKLVELLVKKHLSKLDLNHGNFESPLYMACSFQHVEIVKLLIPLLGIDVNLGKFHEKETPLQKAIEVGNIEIITLLIEYGALFNESDCVNAHKIGVNLYQIKIQVQLVSQFQQLIHLNRLYSDLTFIFQ